MKKVSLDVEEKLHYRRRVVVLVPDNMSDEHLENVLDEAQREDSVSEFVYALKRHGIECPDGYDDDLSSPNYSEVECDYYEFLDEDGDQA